ncbi:rRNA pseudouridine synthase [Cohnella pontilimi]|uniref:Pseudouridine synthase n=1 Tax=Cohnella pontilimi TaxID=2564100 RepID=A0A4U0F9S5_9BACL|nr:pseudouridine synthase [Cohnella pontilimi]TJY41370.1 rRNA pseudouridine synthase [Cohnella pontilimi]
MKKTMRLDKMLGNLGYGTRSGIKQLVRQGAVTVNGQPVKDPGIQIDPAVDTVAFDGETIRYRDTVYVLLHKPAGVVSATEDLRDRTVLDLLDPEIAVFSPFPVGRLDKDTEGLLLLTNDGKLAHDLLSPRKHVPKTYRALVAGEVGDREAEAFRQGVTLDDGYVTLPAALTVLAAASAAEAPAHPEIAEPFRRVPAGRMSEAAAGTVCWIELTIHEGKFHQVKRMFEAVGRQVVYLRRVSMGPLQLDPALAPGEWRELTDEETESLRKYRKDGTN